MNILVCVKQTPDPEEMPVTENASGLVSMDEGAGYRMNRFDEFAVEAAVLLKEKGDGVVVDAITVGPERSRDVIKRAVGMGADKGIHLITGETDLRIMKPFPDPASVAAWIYGYAKNRSYALILTGAMSEDGMNGMVGPMMAAMLGIPAATQVISLELSKNGGGVSIEREVEGGNREILEIKLPAVLALQPGINRPRYPSLSNLLRANKQAMEIIDAESFDTRKSGMNFKGAMFPPRTRAGRLLEGATREKAEAFLNIMKNKGWVR